MIPIPTEYFIPWKSLHFPQHNTTDISEQKHCVKNEEILTTEMLEGFYLERETESFELNSSCVKQAAVLA